MNRKITDNTPFLPYFSPITKCSQCGKLCGKLESYINKNTGKLWCMSCLTKEKIKRIKNYAKKT